MKAWAASKTRKKGDRLRLTDGQIGAIVGAGKSKNKPVKQKMLECDQGWDDAIREAKLQLDRAKQRAAGLELVISQFTAMRDSGQHYPGESATRNHSSTRSRSNFERRKRS
jgi:hypothetical protein